MDKKPYGFDLERFITPGEFSRVKEFTDSRETPFVVMNLDIIERKYAELRSRMPFAKIYYAVKANPLNEIITLLHELGSNFDIASRYELDQLLGLGVAPDRISYGNTIKKAGDIAYAYGKGIRVFVSDSMEDLGKLAGNAPGSRVFFRIFTEGTGSDWPLSRKFGAHADLVYEMILHCRRVGLEPFGLSFHVGSQQRDIGQWDDAIARCKFIFDSVKEEGIVLKMINIGGGLPAEYLDPTLDEEVYAGEIKRFLTEDFNSGLPEIWMEPGRSLAANAGILVSEIVLISRKSRNNLNRWVYLDAGVFGGLIETLGESIKYPVYFDGKGPAEDIILAGPTCDSMDILYEHHKIRMPSNAAMGDRVYFFTAGAYTSSYSSVNFNGFPPLKTLILPR